MAYNEHITGISVDCWSEKFILRSRFLSLKNYFAISPFTQLKSIQELPILSWNKKRWKIAGKTLKMFDHPFFPSLEGKSTELPKNCFLESDGKFESWPQSRYKGCLCWDQGCANIPPAALNETPMHNQGAQQIDERQSFLTGEYLGVDNSTMAPTAGGIRGFSRYWFIQSEEERKLSSESYNRCLLRTCIGHLLLWINWGTKSSMRTLSGSYSLAFPIRPQSPAQVPSTCFLLIRSHCTSKREHSWWGQIATEFRGICMWKRKVI